MPRNFEDPFLPSITGDSLAQNIIDGSVGGILSLRRPGKFMTAARVVLKVNGKLVGFAHSIRWTINTQQEEIWTVDEYTPYEIAPKRISVEGSMGMFHIPNRSPTKELIQSNVMSFMGHRYITIEVRDRQTDALLFLTNRAVVTSRSEEIRSDGLATMTLNWRAVGWVDEMTPAYASGMEAGQEQETSILTGLAARFMP